MYIYTIQHTQKLQWIYIYDFLLHSIARVKGVSVSTLYPWTLCHSFIHSKICVTKLICDRQHTQNWVKIVSKEKISPCT